MISARFTAGHFFRKFRLLIAALAVVSACGGEYSEPEAEQMPSVGSVTLLMELTGPDRSTVNPESIFDIQNTSWGRFHILGEESSDPFQTIFETADSSGMLILAIIPENLDYTGSRDHLFILTNPQGIPMGTEPHMEPGFTADSLWTNPIVRQETIMGLIDFFKPDLVLVKLETQDDIMGITEFWSGTSVTAGIYSQPGQDGYRGWGAFTGTGIGKGIINGMTVRDFQATVMMIAGLEWQRTGYPAMQVFIHTENR